MSTRNNQQQLAAAIGRIKVLVRCKLDGATAGEAVTAEPCDPLDRVATLFGLSPFERDLLLWCAGVELDSTLAELTAALPGREGKHTLTFGLAMAVLPDAHWSALVPSAPLRYWLMVEPGNGGPTRAELKIDERLLHELAGVPYLDVRLTALLHREQEAGKLTEPQHALARRIADVWHERAVERPLLQVTGRDRNTNAAMASHVARQFGLMPYRIDVRQLPARAEDLEGFVRLWQRESILGANVLLVEHHGNAARAEAADPLHALCEQVGTPLFLLGRESVQGLRRTALNFEVPVAARQEQLAFWQEALGPHAATLNGALDRVVDQFHLGWAEIRNAAAQAAGTGVSEVALRQACRAQARPRLEDLAKRIDVQSGWDDLVLAEREKNTLHDIALHLAHRGTVRGKWGLGGNGRGTAISALFAGPSGTGKTLAAEILAKELDLDLYKIDLSQVVSKYIGESEKNLARIFDAAEAGGAILLFDEADALFGKRSEVKDSHDRYANIEVSYLLQRMEEYRGLAILTTNMKQALDSAFMRRLTFVVNFRFPDQAQRAAIWARMFPPACPQDGIDHAMLAQLNIPGGNIRSIAVAAAHYAAADGTALRMPHLLRAARNEYEKLDKALSATETTGWT